MPCIWRNGHYLVQFDKEMWAAVYDEKTGTLQGSGPLTVMKNHISLN
jgi:hypothetical protein